MRQPFVINARVGDPRIQNAMDQLVYELNRRGVTDGHLCVGLSDRSNEYLYPWYHLNDRTPDARQYVGGLLTSSGLTTGAPTPDTVSLTPFTVPKTMRVNRLGFDVTVVAGGADVLLGIYTSTADRGGHLYPDELVVSTPLITPPAPGAQTSAVNATLAGNHLYWLAYATFVASCTIRCVQPADAMAILGFPPVLGATPSWGYQAALTIPGSGQLPSPFPSGASAATGAPIPAVYLQSPGYEGAEEGYDRTIPLFRVGYEGLEVKGAHLLKSAASTAHRYDHFLTVQPQILRDGETIILGEYDSREHALGRGIPYVFHGDTPWNRLLEVGDVVEVRIRVYGGFERELLDMGLQLDWRYIGGR